MCATLTINYMNTLSGKFLLSATKF